MYGRSKHTVVRPSSLRRSDNLTTSSRRDPAFERLSLRVILTILRQVVSQDCRVDRGDPRVAVQVVTELPPAATAAAVRVWLTFSCNLTRIESHSYRYEYNAFPSLLTNQLSSLS